MRGISPRVDKTLVEGTLRHWTVALFLLTALVVPSAPASTLLTNGAPVQFILPQAVFSGQFFGGDLGYAIYVPPGATTLTIDMVPEDPTYSADLLARFASDVGLSGTGKPNFDYVVAGGSGTKQLVIDSHSSPPLQSGTYFIAFSVTSQTQPQVLTLTATVEGGSVQPIRTITISNFDTDLDGWLRNADASSMTAASQGDPASRLDWRAGGGKPGGFALHYKAGFQGAAALVAPAKFLGNLGALPEPRFEFDYLQVSGTEPVYPVEIRIFGSGSAFSWAGSVPPAPPVVIDTGICTSQMLDPATGNSTCVSPWTHYTASLQSQWWNRIAGDTSFAKVLSSVERIEVMVGLSFFDESAGVDNFALLSRGPGPPKTVLAGNTSFVSGADGWARNFPASDLTGATTGNADATFRWVPFEGNPGGYVRVSNAGGDARDYLVAPSRFLGNYQNLPNAQIEFDYEHFSAKGATRPVEVRLVGSQTVFAWTGGRPSSTWTHYIAPLNEPLWRRVSGTGAFSAVLANVERIEISVDQADGPESNGLDNFWLLPGPISPAPPAISANPVAVSFSAIAGSASPAAQTISVTSIGGGVPLGFSAAASGGNWLRISAASGTTPRAFDVSANINGLAEGTYTGSVTVTSTSAALPPQTVAVNLTVKSRAGSTPRINPGGVVNAASGRAQLAPGSLGTIFGSGLGSDKALLASFAPGTAVLPSRLQGIRVLVNETSGVLIAEAPLLYLSDTQINFQLPFETLGRSEVSLVVDNNGVRSEPRSVQVVSNSPGIFTYGDNHAVAVNDDDSVNASETPVARRGVLTVYMTGQGVVTPTVPTGAAAPSRPLARAPFPAQASIGGVPAQIQFVGLAPGFVGVLQVNVAVPSAAPSGDSLLVVTIGGGTSNSAVVSVK